MLGNNNKVDYTFEGLGDTVKVNKESQNNKWNKHMIWKDGREEHKAWNQSVINFKVKNGAYLVK